MHHIPGIIKSIALSLCTFIVASASLADGIPNEDICYDPSIKTIQVFKDGFELAPPLIQLNSTESISIQFDDLDPELKRYKFTILH